MSERFYGKSIRKEKFDYSQPGKYFITISTHNDSYLFGDILDGQMILNDPGRMIENSWNELPRRFPNTIIDENMVMPNHFHGIIFLLPSESKIPLGNIIGAFKSLTTNKYIANVKENGWRPFTKKLWHWNFFDHIIRSDVEYREIKKYIQNNPQNWKLNIRNQSQDKKLLREEQTHFNKKSWMI